MVEINCDNKTARQINAEIKALIREGDTNLTVKNPGARHNLGVAILEPISLTFAGSVGYYCGGMIDRPEIRIKGSAGWGLAESMMDGTVIVEANAGNGAAAAIRGGTVVVHGDVAARAGVSLKGGLVVVGGNCGYMTGFMGQKGTLIICGNAGPAFADSMYQTVCFVGGEIAQLGSDAVIDTATDEDFAFLETTLTQYVPTKTQDPNFDIRRFKKVVAGRKLWNFDKGDWRTWREVM